MHSCNPDPLPAQDVFWVNSAPANDTQTEFTITDLANEFGLTHRALRFYDSRGLLSPQREGRKRIFTRADRDRLMLILKAKQLGFTLAEISQMIEAQSGQANEQSLKLSAAKCLEQIAFFEKQMRDAAAALTELRRIHLSLCVQTVQDGAKQDGERG